MESSDPVCTNSTGKSKLSSHSSNSTWVKATRAKRIDSANGEVHSSIVSSSEIAPCLPAGASSFSGGDLISQVAFQRASVRENPSLENDARSPRHKQPQTSMPLVLGRFFRSALQFRGRAEWQPLRDGPMIDENRRVAYSLALSSISAFRLAVEMSLSPDTL